MTETAKTEVTLRLTPRAVEEVRHLLQQPDNMGKFLRVYVEQGGCSGMQYGLTFDEKRDGDQMAEQDGLMTLVDSFSAKFLEGTVVDFSDELTGGGFKLSNPNAKQSCGCGKSFEA